MKHNFHSGQEVRILRKFRSYDKNTVGVLVSSKDGQAVVKLISITGRPRQITMPLSAIAPYEPFINSPWADMGYSSDRGGPVEFRSDILSD